MRTPETQARIDASTAPRSRASHRTPCLRRDRKSTRLNSSHSQISYAVFCLKKKRCLNYKTDSGEHSWTRTIRCTPCSTSKTLVWACSCTTYTPPAATSHAVVSHPLHIHAVI